MGKRVPVRDGYQPRPNTEERGYQPGSGNGSKPPAPPPNLGSNIQPPPAQSPLKK